MSIRVMTMVWDCPHVDGGSELLALLALADWSDDNGRCFPSMGAIARKTRLSPRQAQRVAHQLIDAGFVSVVGNEFGGDRGATRQYRINLSRLTGDAHVTGDTGDTRVMDDAKGCHGRRVRGDTHVTQTINEPSLTTKKPSAKKKPRTAPVGIDSFLKACSEAGQKPIPEDDPVFDYGELVGIPTEFMHLAWREFVHRNRDSGKRYADWRKAFRNCIRGNWYKLWFASADGDVSLTTQGVLTQKLHREAA